MAKKSAPTPLYELMARSGERAAQTPHHHHSQRQPEPSADYHEPEGDHLLSPGRRIRLPVGYVFLALAGLVVLLILTYMFGSAQGQEQAKERYERILLDEGRETISNLAVDPLAERGSGTGAGVNRPASGDNSNGIGAPGSGSSRSARGTQGEAGWGPIESDPRRSGWYYLVIAETRPDGAVRLAEFCRENGLEAYVVKSNNARTRRWVIVRPGFPKESLSGPEDQRLREEVRRVGRLWKATRSGESDLSDMYPVKG